MRSLDIRSFFLKNVIKKLLISITYVLFMLLLQALLSQKKRFVVKYLDIIFFSKHKY